MHLGATNIPWRIPHDGPDGRARNRCGWARLADDGVVRTTATECSRRVAFIGRKAHDELRPTASGIGFTRNRPTARLHDFARDVEGNAGATHAFRGNGAVGQREFGPTTAFAGT